MDLWTLHRGDSPLVIDVPHAGTHVPDALRPRLSAIARATPKRDARFPPIAHHDAAHR